MTRPNFFIVGAPKCATTAMYSYLKEHPEVFMSEQKELHFFGSDLRRDLRRSTTSLEDYLSHFRDVSGERVVGEGSIWYLYSRYAAEEIKVFNPDARILAMIRNPIDAMHSLHSQLLYTGEEDITDFASALGAEADRRAGRRIPPGSRFVPGLFYREAVKFSSQLRRYLEAFGRERVHIIVLDDLRRDPERSYASVLDFLGVERSFQPQFVTVNPNKEIRNRFVKELLRAPAVKRIVQILVPHKKLRSSIYRVVVSLNTKRSERDPIPPQLRDQLRKEMASEVEDLGALLQRDLSYWLI